MLPLFTLFLQTFLQDGVFGTLIVNVLRMENLNLLSGVESRIARSTNGGEKLIGEVLPPPPVLVNESSIFKRVTLAKTKEEKAPEVQGSKERKKYPKSETFLNKQKGHSRNKYDP
jgi:hypothetical protein